MSADEQDPEEQPADATSEGAPPVGSGSVHDTGGEEAEAVESIGREAIAVALPTIAAAVMVGGVFTGVSPRIFAGIAGILGVGLAVLANRFRSTAAANTVIVVGLVLIGPLLILPSSPGDIGNLGTLIRDASQQGDLARPPVDWSIGWQAIVGWLMGIVGFGAAWIAVAVRRPALGVLIPLPIAAIAGISVPDEAQVASGLVTLVLFAVSLGVLSSDRAVSEDGTRPPVGYELRRAAKALPFLAVVTGALFGLAQTDLLFPEPRIDPAQEPQRPKTVPISEVEDRVLFEVTSELSGPWRVGSLDVYDGVDWRLPPFADNELEPVPSDGVVDEELFGRRGPQAEFVVRGFNGAVLPGLANAVGIVASGPSLEYDGRTGNIRVENGEIAPGLEYTVVAAALPSIDELRRSDFSVPDDLRPFVEDMPDPPPAVVDLLTEAQSRFDNEWDQFDHLRTYVLDNVVSSGAGAPVALPPERVQEILGDTLEASPFEIVGLQALLARWNGIPSRIGYGFDGGEEVGEQTLAVRPKHGASFVEVHFPGFKWLPVVGTPKQAEPSIGTDAGEQRIDPTILPSDDIGVELLLPLIVPPKSVAAQQAAVVVAIVAGVLLLLFLAYLTYPALRKARLRRAKREAALRCSPRLRIAHAYAEFRDTATDLGYRHDALTPLAFLDVLVDDDEHTELAWLTTRALWGDLRETVDEEDAVAADELSRSLRRRLNAAQPGTVRLVSAVSRLSLRHPFAPELSLANLRALGARWQELSAAGAGRATDAVRIEDMSRDPRKEMADA